MLPKPREPKTSESDWPYEPHFLTLDGKKYAYLDEHADRDRNGPVLLFVHGNPTTSYHWRRLIAAQRGHFRCIAPDHFGCGNSSLQPRPLRLADHIENLLQLIESLDLQQVTLVAQDWGGAIGLGALLKATDRFERIALFNTGAFPPWFIPWRIRLCRWPVFGRLALQGANAFCHAAFRMALARKAALEPDVARVYLDNYPNWQRRAAIYQFVKDIPLSSRHPTWETLAEIERGLSGLASMPQLLVWGMRDWCFTPACLDKFCEYWPDAEVHRLADVGHWVVEDAPEQADQRLEDWLNRTASLTAGANH